MPGEQLGVDRWHYSATTQHGPDRLMPGGAAVGLFAGQPVAAAVVLMSHHERPSPHIDLRFVSVRQDGVLDSTGNTPPLIPMAGTDQTYDQRASARELWEAHCERVAGSVRPAELSEIVEKLGPAGDQVNPIRQAGFIRFVTNWAPNAWRRSGSTAALPG